MTPMDKNDIFTGKTIEECKQKASEAFGVPVDKITFEVLEEPKRGLFGKLKSEAKVLAGYDIPPEPEEPSFAEVKTEEIGRKNRVERIRKYLTNILEKMEIEAQLDILDLETGIVVNIDCNGSGAVIGRRGETLDALQYLTSLVANKDEAEYIRVSLDSSGYREKRTETLVSLAKKLSDKVMRTGRSTTLEPMNPYERRIIHSTVSEIEGVSSHSVGTEPYRKVVITSDNPKKHDGGRRNGGGQRNKKRSDGPRSLDLKTSFEKDYKKPKPEDDIHAGLYGKIEF